MPRMEISEIAVFDDGRWERWFDDGDIFWDHAIRVGGDFASGSLDTGIEG